jgi:hypothetical protein
VLGRVRYKQDPRSLWLGKMRQRRHPNIVAVALANKNARIAWSLLTSDSVCDASLSVRGSLRTNSTRKDKRAGRAIASVGGSWRNGHSVASRTLCLDRHGSGQCLGAVGGSARKSIVARGDDNSLTPHNEAGYTSAVVTFRPASAKARCNRAGSIYVQTGPESAPNPPPIKTLSSTDRSIG